MKTRAYTRLDRPTLEEWWQGYDWPSPREDHLPKRGLVAFDPETNERLAAGFLYETDSAFCWMEWIVGNPTADKFKRREAIDILITDIVRLGKELGFKSVFTSLANPRLKEAYIKAGFIETDKSVNNYVRGLG